jgi:probable phosphoglycerate mutase
MHDAPRLWLVRHGETDWNREGRIQGSKDSPLTPLGRKHAERQGRVFDRLMPEVADLALFVSPLERARLTARIALPGHAQIVDPRLTEIACGDWEGLSPDERAVGWPDLVAGCHSDLDLYERAPGGEGIDGVEARVSGFLNDLDAPSIVVAHSVVLIVLRGLLRGLERDALHDLHAPQGVVIEIENGQETHLI